MFKFTNKYYRKNIKIVIIIKKIEDLQAAIGILDN
jgi:hypothetical protein